MVSRRSLLKAGGALGVGVLALAVVLVGLVATGVLAQPTVESIESDWGNVSDERTEIRTTVVAQNPNPIGIPGVLDVSYEARLNSVTLAQGERGGIGFSSGENRLVLATEMENDRIADWWITHVDRGERSRLSVDANVSGPGFSRAIPATSSSIETDIAAGVEEGGAREVALGGEPLLVLSDQEAAWGAADESTTPLTVSTAVENAHDYPVSLDAVEYEVELNGVVLGEGRDQVGLTVQPGETDSLETTMALETRKMSDWWAAHVRDDEASNLTAELYGVVERDGDYRRIPIQFVDRELRLETDMLGDDDTSIETIGGDADRPEFDRPTVGDTDSEWGAVTDETTEIETAITLDNPTADSRLNELVTLETDQETTINGISVADGAETVEGLTAGTNELDLTVEKDNSRVPEWWARHVNDGEQSTRVTNASTTADVGLTRFDVESGERTSEFETDLLSGMNGDRDEELDVAGETALVVSGVASEWGEATFERAPIHTEATVENQQDAEMEITDVRYTVTLNDVVLADGTDGETHTVAPGATDTVPLTMELDNSKMDEWWVTHVRNDERSEMDVTVVATVETPAGSETVPLESLGQSETVETDLLGSED